MSEVRCDRKISLRVKEKMYKTVVRLAMMYGHKTRKHKRRGWTDMGEMRMLRRKYGVTKIYKIRNGRI